MSQISLWQAGSVVVEFVWHHSIALPGKPLVGRKDLLHISHTSRVIADFVSNFVAMATRVGRGRTRICVTSFNSPTPKTPCWTKRSPRYLVFKPSYGRFCLKFRCHSNGVGHGRSFLASLNSQTTKPPRCTQASRRYLLYKPSYSRFFLKFSCHGNGGWSW